MLHSTGAVALDVRNEQVFEGDSVKICLEFLHPTTNCSAFKLPFETYFKYGVNSDGKS